MGEGIGPNPYVEKMELQKKRGIPYRKRILVTGSSGFLGHHIVPVLESFYPAPDVVRTEGKKFFDLTQQAHARAMFGAIRNEGAINTVVHLAALSGGIEDNRMRQASYFYQNMTMLLNIMATAAAQPVEKILLFMGGCSYPNTAESPIKEEQMWDGFPNENSYGYSMAKKMGIIAAMAYEQEFNTRTTVLIPTNLIGEWDNFSAASSHVVPALIRRFIEAKDDGLQNVVVWGTGKPVRDFIYAGDVARVVPYFIQKYHEVGPVNISTGKGTSIAEIAEIIAKAVGFEGNIKFDTSMPDGQAVKILDCTKLETFLKEEEVVWKPMPVQEAILRTVEWYYKRVYKK